MALNKFDKRKALKIKESYYLPLEKKVFRIFFDILYKPIFNIISEHIGKEWLQKENSKKSKETLIKAILSGKVQYIDKHFEGTFNSLISKEIKEMGGKWDPKRKRWFIKEDQIPFDIRTAISQAQMKDRALNADIEQYLNKIDNQLKENDTLFNFEDNFQGTIQDLDALFKEGIKNITTSPDLTDEMIKNLAESWSNNMNLYIKGWTQESIKRLRARIWNNSLNGFRSINLVKEIQHDYNISENKARFLARQETSLLMSKFREERYKSAGVQKYKWSTSGDSRVRERHKELNGKIFDWDNPPIVDELGNRAHPGEDYNCRCVAIPQFQ